MCDGSHKGSDFKPLKYIWESDDKDNVHVCGCKVNFDKSGPFCDKTHKYHDFTEIASKPVGFFRTKEHEESVTEKGVQANKPLRDCTPWMPKL